MTLSRNDLLNYAGVENLSAAKTKNALMGIMSSLIKEHGITALKEETPYKHKGAKAHLYIVEELVVGLELFLAKNWDNKKFKTSAQKSVAMKLQSEMQYIVSHDIKIHTCQENNHELTKLEKTLKKGIRFMYFENGIEATLVKSTKTMNRAICVILRGRKLQWMSKASKFKSTRHEFATNAQAVKWKERHMVDKIF